MAGYVLSVAFVAVLAGLVMLAWRAFARPRSRRRLVARLVVACVVAVPVSAALLYALMNSRSVQLAGRLVAGVPTTDKVVALTFDDGPTPVYTGQTLRVLAEHGAKATFFVTGAEATSDMADLRAIVAAGHEVGNHSWDHARLVYLPAEKVAEEIGSTDRVIRAAGFAGPILVRTPNGKRLLTAPLHLAATGRVNVFWGSEPDSDPSIANDPAAMTARVLRDVGPGSIVLMHVMYDSRGASRSALPRILDELSARGYRFVTVSELMAEAGR